MSIPFIRVETSTLYRGMPALMAACWIGVAAAQAGVLDAPMQAIKKKPAAAAPCAGCAAGDPLIAGLADSRGKERSAPEFPAAQSSGSAGGDMNAAAPLLEVPSIDGAGAGAVSVPATPALQVR